MLLRFLLVPLGYMVAVLAGTAVVLLGSWRLAEVDPDGELSAAFGLMLAAPALLVMLLCVMWLPAAIGILISETFAVRSWLFHAANGAASAWIGWSLFGYVEDNQIPLDQPVAVLAAGLAGGLAYWAVAGWSAGFWKPVLRREPAAERIR
ncbi:MAG: hypothetical protein IT537_26530 [Hyphomicrobiales bacterium]|nr:hypothetical protein [Hyphomicrobiales bacterium]